MTISTTSAAIVVQGTGASFAFAFPFVADQSSDISCYYTDANGDTIQLLSSQFTVTLNATYPGQLWGIGGIVTYPLSGSAIAVGTSLTIIRVIPDTQEVSISNQGAFYPTAVEQAVDITVLEIQQLAYSLSKCVQVPIGSSLTPLQYLMQLIAGLIPAGGSSPFTGNSITTTINYTVISTDVTIRANAVSNTIAVVLPSPTVSFGRILNIKKVDSSANAVSLIGLVDGITTYSLSFVNQSVTIQSNGTSWDVL